MALPAPQSPQGRRIPARPSDEVFRVTSAQTPLSQEQKARTKRYLISMSIRTVCFLGAIVASGWLRWTLLIGAIVLPYVAVIMANAGRENDPFTGPEPVPDIDLTKIEKGKPEIDK